MKCIQQLFSNFLSSLQLPQLILYPLTNNELRRKNETEEQIELLNYRGLTNAFEAKSMPLCHPTYTSSNR